MQRARDGAADEKGENKEQEDHPKHASLIRQIENQYRLSVSEPISRTAACSAANAKRDVHQNEIMSSPVSAARRKSGFVEKRYRRKRRKGGKENDSWTYVKF